jgi:hypothetical protein
MKDGADTQSINLPPMMFYCTIKHTIAIAVDRHAVMKDRADMILR